MNATQLFETHVMPCLDVGYNLARWLLRDEAAAEDALQEAALRAFRHLGSAKLESVRPWFLQIVRNTCFSYLQRSSSSQELTGWEADDFDHLLAASGRFVNSPEAVLLDRHERERVDAAIQALPAIWREVIVLRELQELSYADIALVTNVAIGTVMSRLSRARSRLRVLLADNGSTHDAGLDDQQA